MSATTKQPQTTDIRPTWARFIATDPADGVKYYHECRPRFNRGLAIYTNRGQKQAVHSKENEA